jgi:hypothetical protein
MVDSLPIFPRCDLEDSETNSDYDFESSILSDEQIIKKMMKLQRNLHEKQLGLMRCIDEFEDFRTKLMVGQPKYSNNDLMHTFNPKQYALNMGLHFSGQLQQIQERINNLKVVCRKTEDTAIQCCIEGYTEQELQARTILESSKVLTLKSEAEIRRLGETCSKLQESIKAYSAEVKHLSSKMAELDQNNHDLKQELFIQQLKLKGKEKEQ